MNRSVPPKSYYADLHVHVGSALGRAVKVTASRGLTISEIVRESRRKGIDIVGIVDSQVNAVIVEFESLVSVGFAWEPRKGGLLFEAGPLIVFGVEMEFSVSGGSFHLLAFLPDTRSLRSANEFLKGLGSNPDVSVPKCRVHPKLMARFVSDLGGWLSLAHAFTPFKGFYGSCLPRVSGVLEPGSELTAVELGLSADSDMGDRIDELQNTSFLSNSDAHSASKIAREYNQLRLYSLDFEEVSKAIRGTDGRRIEGNIGIDPRLGKYHRSFCIECGRRIAGDPPRFLCPVNPSHRTIAGVLDRVTQIGDRAFPLHPGHRPPYEYHIPLEFIPGIGPKTRERLIRRFGNEIKLFRDAAYDEIALFAGERVANLIDAARKGRFSVEAGAGGFYGKVSIDGRVPE